MPVEFVKKPLPKKPTQRGVAAGHKGLVPPMPVAEQKKFRIRAATIDWPNLRETWELSHLNNAPMTLADVAKKFNAAPSTVFNKSAEQKWVEELAFKMKNRDDIVGQALVERGEQAVQKLNEDFITREAEVRRRHSLMAKGLQAKAFARLRAIDPNQLKPGDAIAMLKLGLDEERRALGLPDVAITDPGESTGSLPKEYKPLTQQMEEHKRIQSMGVALLRRIQERTGTNEVSDAQVLNSVGLGDAG